jgi:hypothetical protein
MRNHRLHELIAACAARGLDPRVVREALEMATDKGVRKLAHGFVWGQYGQVDHPAADDALAGFTQARWPQ